MSRPEEIGPTDFGSPQRSTLRTLADRWESEAYEMRGRLGDFAQGEQLLRCARQLKELARGGTV